MDGSPLITFTITQGLSTIHAKLNPSCMREKPGPDVAVKAFLPDNPAAVITAIEEISSSIWINVFPLLGISLESTSKISLEGVIG